jgi:rfaE bifunctional protein nucleotidyltransferase chain/domain/rfaE bifunctional protein kinase chain/domain
VRIVVVGDALLDRDLDGRIERLCPEAPVPVVDELVQRSRPGGAGLAAALAAKDGADVTLVTALADDSGGRELAELLHGAAVDVVDLGLRGQTPVKTRVRTDGSLLLRLDQGERSDIGPAPEAALGALANAEGVLVSDYGRGITDEPTLRDGLASAAARVSVVWDPHPRGAPAVARCALLTPNLRELEADGRLVATERRARTLLSESAARAVAVTMGANGALLVDSGPAVVVPAAPISGGDPCGAGDAFAATAATRLAAGADTQRAVADAVEAATAFVAAGGAGAFALEPEWQKESDVEELIRRVHGKGGRVVATGGCFDLIHAGHISTLQAARALGDCLIVCLNSDASVRRLKGPDRPLVEEEERAAVLRALRCVDAVVAFDEDTPEAVLERLRPDVFAKGGDYSLDELPEARLLERWGGEAVILPFVENRSTTQLLAEAAGRVG